jgi:perosamine synthetase
MTEFYTVPQLEPYIDWHELDNLKEVIKNKWLTEGPFSKKFIQQIKDYTGAKHVNLAPNGTLAIYLSLLALGIKKGDEIIVPDFTFNATASPVVFAGADPVFVDVHDSDLNIDVNKIEEAITAKTKAIMPVHIYGQSANMQPILDIAEDNNLKIIEDAAESYGVFYKNLDQPTNCTGTLGDLGVISFFADKTLTMGEGAVILTDDDQLDFNLKNLRNQGRLQSGSFKHPLMGMNFRVTDLQCAVGVAQLDKFEEIKELKLKHYNLYKELLEGTGVKFLEEKPYSTRIPFRVVIKVTDKQKVMKYLEDNKIQTRGVFYPLHRQPCFEYLGYGYDAFPVSNKAFDEGICLPVYPGLKEWQIEYICAKIIDVTDSNKIVKDYREM